MNGGLVMEHPRISEILFICMNMPAIMTCALLLGSAITVRAQLARESRFVNATCTRSLNRGAIHRIGGRFGSVISVNLFQIFGEPSGLMGMAHLRRTSTAFTFTNRQVNTTCA